MVALNHEPEEINEGYPEGVYSIKVKQVDCPHTFRSGSVGMVLYFDVWNSNGVGFETRENIVTSLTTTKWKLKELCNCLGLDYDNESLDSEEFMNKEGKANMTREPGSKWLSVDSYLSVDCDDAKTDAKPVDAPQDSVPF
tara:strand:+ start:1295 stop:1714 length:420 start_codon:yes stop_codon:yes gene_type:complete